MKIVCYITLFAIVAQFCTGEEEVVILNDDITKETPLILSCGDVDMLGENDTILWVYHAPDGNYEKITGPNLNVNVTDGAAAGKYFCYLNNEEKASYLAARLTTPEIVNTRKSVTYNDGDKDRKLTCSAEGSYPEPEFMWSTRKGEEEEKTESADLNPNFFIETNGTKSVLRFNNVTYDDGANYICQIKNVAGNNTVEVLVRVKDKYAAVWPFIGIVTEVIILISIIFLYERHSKKASAKEDVNVNPEEEKPLNRDEGMEIRNRNGSK